MEVIVIEKESYRRLLIEIQNMIKRSVKDAVETGLDTIDPSNDWITEDEAQKRLGVTSNTKLKLLRNKGDIKFTRDGRIYMYSKKSISDFHERNRVVYK